MATRVFGMGETVTAVTGGDGANKSPTATLFDNKLDLRRPGGGTTTPGAAAAPGGRTSSSNRKKTNQSPGSACHSNASLSRHKFSLFKMANEMRARRVRFYRNGDRFFKGMVYAVSTEKFRTLENLLASLTSSPVCDSRSMPNGVRHIFTVDGAKKVDSLDELEEGQNYVCASSDVFRTLDYSQNEDPSWVKYVHPTSRSVSPATSRNSREEMGVHSTSKGGGTLLDERPSSAKVAIPAIEKRQYEEYQRSFVIPRLVTVIKHGKRPRDAVRLLLNKKTAQTFDQVMTDISEAIKLDCGQVKKLYAISGKLVTCLADFFEDDLIFLAYGPESVTSDDFNLDDAEVRQVRAYRPFTGKGRERVTLRRKSASSYSNGYSSDAKDELNYRSEAVPSDEKISDHAEKSNSELQFPTNEEDFDISKVPMPELLNLKYEVGALIGTGNFAVVLECKDKTTRRKYALKIINRKSCKGREKMLDNEVRILRRVKHPNIIRLIEDFSHQHCIFYIMELVKGGDLFNAISISTKYTEQDAGGILYNLASALHYLHSLQIVHRDVKPENLLIRQHDDGTKSLKLGDFGLATEVHKPLFTVCGTPTYVAPEVIAETGYGVKIDIWSAGVITYILLCGFPPFVSETDDQSELFDLIMSATFDFPSPFWNDVSQQAKNLITQMLEIDQDARLTAKEVLEDKWVASETAYEADLRKVVSSGIKTHFRRGHRPVTRNDGVQIMARTALDKASRFFPGRKSLQNKGYRMDEE